MWRMAYEETTSGAGPSDIWRLWADVSAWSRWNGDVSAATIDGAFEDGATIRMSLTSGDVIELVLIDVQPGRAFTDRAVVDGIAVTTTHRVDEEAHGTVVAYALQVQGDAPPHVLREIGQAVSADFPSTVRSLISAAA